MISTEETIKRQNTVWWRKQPVIDRTQTAAALNKLASVQ